MTIVAVCGLMVLAGLAAAVRWGNLAFRTPAADPPPAPLEVARRFAWYIALLLLGGPLAGVAVIGAGGRLAMRLLAVTAGSDAQGRVTEADQVVGEITTGGTLDFVLFNGIFGGVVFGAVYLVVRRFLPPGRLGGVAFGLGLLVVVGTNVDPLRRDNPDFDIVGPGWLAVVVFAAMAVAFGLTLAAVLARLSEWLPLLSKDRRVLVRYALPALIAVPLLALTALLAGMGLAVVAVTRSRAVVDAVRSRRAVLLGRVVVAGLVVVALPNAVITVVDIAGR
jgi:hypothetical protein